MQRTLVRFHQYKLHNITYLFTGYYKLTIKSNQIKLQLNKESWLVEKLV